MNNEVRCGQCDCVGFIECKDHCANCCDCNEYQALLNSYYQRALMSEQHNHMSLQKRKVSAIVAIGKLQDEMKVKYGAGKEPIEVLYACRDLMAATAI